MKKIYAQINKAIRCYFFWMTAVTLSAACTHSIPIIYRSALDTNKPVQSVTFKCAKALAWYPRACVSITERPSASPWRRLRPIVNRLRTIDPWRTVYEIDPHLFRFVPFHGGSSLRATRSIVVMRDVAECRSVSWWGHTLRIKSTIEPASVKRTYKVFIKFKLIKFWVYKLTLTFR